MWKLNKHRKVRKYLKTIKLKYNTPKLTGCRKAVLRETFIVIKCLHEKRKFPNQLKIIP